MRIYLARPEVFLPDPAAAGENKKRICAAHGCVGVYPLDNALDLSGMSGPDAGYAIYRANRELMDSCDAVIANLTPFRGPSADAGTVFELGYMRGVGKRLAAYSNIATRYADRVRQHFPEAKRGADGAWRDGDGMLIEEFGLADNLMLEGALREGGIYVFAHDAQAEVLFTDLTAFEQCVKCVANKG
jgi:nucleoside 2-deoxyribosyltransferase